MRYTHIYTQANDDVLLTVCVEEEEELYTTTLLVGPETPCVRVIHAQLHTLEDPPSCKFPSGIEYRALCSCVGGEEFIQC